MHIAKPRESTLTQVLRREVLAGIAAVLFVLFLLAQPQQRVSSIRTFWALGQWLFHVDFTDARTDDIRIVSITRADYIKHFDGKSPLRVDQLKLLLQAVALGHPRVIGVDIDTSDSSFLGFEQDLRRGVPGMTEEELQILNTVPIVWAIDGAFSRVQSKVFLKYVLGERNLPDRSGPPVLIKDNDGISRYYSHLVATDDCSKFPTFAWRVFAEVKPWRKPDTRPGLRRLIRYRLPEMGPRSLDEADSKPRVAALMIDGINRVRQESRRHFRDKIVLVGGTYDTTDEHRTVFGWRPGVEILYEIIATELEGGGVKAQLLEHVWGAIVIVAVVLTFLLSRLSPTAGLVTGGVIFLVGPPTLSYVFYSSYFHVLSFALVLLGPLLYGVRRHAKGLNAAQHGESG